MPIELLQNMLEQPGRANAMFIAATGEAASQSTLSQSSLSQSVPGPPPPPLSLADYGLALQATAAGYWRLSSERMLFEPEVVRQAMQLFAADSPHATQTYLANTIALASKAEPGAEIPYSTIAAIDFAETPPQGPFLSPEGKPIPPLGEGEIALNDWAVGQLGAKLGDEIRVDYFKPESVHGHTQETSARLRLAAIVAMTGRGADRELTPELRGVTDQKSIADWDPPFPFEPGRVRKVDEQYWDRYRTTPKAFVSLATGQRLWNSRFGDVTSIEINPVESSSIESLGAELAARLDPASMGVTLLPVRKLALMASRGTTPFNLLFLGFSMFLIVAAALLVALLFGLGIERRAREIGVLEAAGFSARRIYWLLAGEGLVITCIGSALGAVAGLGYAWLMLVGLRTWWLAAVSTPFLRLYWSGESLLIGFASGVLVSLVAVHVSLRRLRRMPVRRLLAGQTEVASLGPAKTGARPRWIAAGSATLALASGFAALGLGGEAQAGAFFASGAAVLAAWIAMRWSRLKRIAARSALSTGAFPLVTLAGRNEARHPARSSLAMGLVASASFLIIAIGAFELDPASELGSRNSGSGGFAILGQSSQPIYQYLSSREVRDQLGFSTDDEKVLAGAKILGLRLRGGDDASCLNLYQPTQPRVLGVPRSLVERGGFAWSSTLAKTPREQENPWLLLEKPASDDGSAATNRSTAESIIPGVLDENTAMYSLHLGLGDRLAIDDDHGRRLKIEIVGLLKNSMFQGSVLVGEQSFIDHFPNSSGYRYFLVEPGEIGANGNAASGASGQGHGAAKAIAGVAKQQLAARVAATERVLEDRLGDYGFTCEPSAKRLASLMAVQNTYLATFQSLGGLGLLLGVVGLAAVELRSVFERRGELALMRAVGFRRRRLAALVMLENLSLLAGGLVAGVFAAAVAVAPHLVGSAAGLPWMRLTSLLAVVLAAGAVAGLGAARATLAAPLIAALRDD